MDKHCSVITLLMLAYEVGEDIEHSASRSKIDSSADPSVWREEFGDIGRFDTPEEGRADTEIAAGGEPVAETANPFVCVRTLNDNDPDSRLVEAAKLGDRGAFSELSARYRALLYQKMFRLVRNRQDAEDLVQDTLLKAFNHLDRFRGAAKFSTWLFRIGINSALELLRRKRRSQETSFERRQEDGERWEAIECPDPAPTVEQMYVTYEANCLVSLALRRLPRTYQILVRGYHEEEQSLSELACRLGISIAAAKARLFRARLTLRSLLKNGQLSIVRAEMECRKHVNHQSGRRPKAKYD
jgi:RNA polymerase sigma-70 factor, ECF subfamily